MKNGLQFNPTEINPVHIFNALFIGIVLYLHHRSYTNDYVVIGYKLNILIQKFAIGGFFFFSGMKMAVSKIETPITAFIKNRIKRIYILYVAALIFASFTTYPFAQKGDYPNIFNFIIHLLCLQSIVPDFAQTNYVTLWFVSILFCCYLYFLISRKDIQKNDYSRFFIKTLGGIIVLYIVHLASPSIHHTVISVDFIIYLSFFSAGLLMRSEAFSELTTKKAPFLAGICTLLLIIMIQVVKIDTWYEILMYHLLIVPGNVSLFIMLLNSFKKYKMPKRYYKHISMLSYSSFCVFLFHRSIWSIMAGLWPKGSFPQWIYIIIFGIPLIICFSFYVQTFYDKLISCMADARENGNQ